VVGCFSFENKKENSYRLRNVQVQMPLKGAARKLLHFACSAFSFFFIFVLLFPSPHGFVVIVVILSGPY